MMFLGNPKMGASIDRQGETLSWWISKHHPSGEEQVRASAPTETTGCKIERVTMLTQTWLSSGFG